MISIVRDLMTAKIGTVISIIFGLAMLSHVLFQIKSWVEDPELISSRVENRTRILFLASLSMTTLLTFLFFDWNVEWWFLAFGIALGFATSFVSLSSALAFLITLLIIRPFEISTSDAVIQALPRAAVLTVFVMFVSRSITERSMKIIWTRECTILGIMAVWFLFTSTQASDPAAAREIYINTFLRGAVLFYVIINVLRNLYDITLFKYVLLSSSLGITFSAIIYDTYFQVSSSGRLNYIGLLGDPNDITAFAIMVLPFALRPLWSSFEKWYAAIFSIIYFILTCVIIYLAQSRGAIISFLTLLICIFVYKIKNKRTALLLAVFLGSLYFPTQILLNREAGDLSQSGSNRLTYWTTAVHMAIRHPFTGVGFNDYPSHYSEYLTGVIESESGKRTAHSSWLLVLAENGFFGLFLFVSLFIIAGQKAYLIRETHPEYLFSLISYGVGMTFLSHAYLLFPYLLLAFTYCASDIISSKAKI